MGPSKLIIIASHIPIFIAAAYGAWVYKKLGKELKAFCYFLFLSAILQLIALILWFYKLNNLPLLHILVAFGFACLGFFYKVVLEGFIGKSLIYAITILFFAFSLVNSAFIQPVTAFNSYALTAESFLVVIFSLSIYTFLLNEVVKEKRKDIVSLNWINSGLFIYYFSNLVVFYSGDLMMRAFSDSFNRHVWVLHSLFSVIMYVCFFIGLWKRSRN